MDGDKYTLTWQTYSDHLRGMMREMMTSGDFADVTLVCDDRKSIRAHRNILSACSLVFKDILQLPTQSNHPVIYLMGIQFSEIESILQFMYLGEAKFYEERMNEFLAVAKSLSLVYEGPVCSISHHQTKDSMVQLTAKSTSVSRQSTQDFICL